MLFVLLTFFPCSFTTRGSSSAQGPLLPEHREHIGKHHDATPTYLPYVPFRPRAVNAILTTHPSVPIDTPRAVNAVPTTHPSVHIDTEPQSMHPASQSRTPQSHSPSLTSVAAVSQAPVSRPDTPYGGSSADCRSRRALNRADEAPYRRASSRSRSPDMSGRASTLYAGQCQFSACPATFHTNVSSQALGVSGCCPCLHLVVGNMMFRWTMTFLSERKLTMTCFQSSLEPPVSPSRWTRVPSLIPNPQIPHSKLLRQRDLL